MQKPKIQTRLEPRTAARIKITSLIGLACLIVLIGVKLVTVLDQLRSIDKISSHNVLIERQIADIRSYALETQQLATAPESRREAMVGRIDAATSLIAAQQVELFNAPYSPPDIALQSEIRYEVSRLLALAAMLRAPVSGLPTTDLTDQLRMLGETQIPQLLRRWGAAQTDQIQATRWQITLTLSVFCLLILIAILLFWQFALRPLSRSVLSGTEHARALEDALNHSAFHDRLTGLSNRRHSAEMIERHLNRRRKSGVGIIHLDLFHFRLMNEELGHEVGDQILIHTADRLSSLVKGREFVARIGSDEFMILVDDVPSPEVLITRAREVRRCLSAEMSLPKGSREIDCRIGAVWSENGMTDSATLSKHADIALRSAVTGEDGPIRLFTHEMHEESIAREALGRELRLALDAGELLPFFQPQVSAKTGDIVGFEALIRWQHPIRGLLGPGVFLRLAEEMGLADRIGAHVLDQSLEAWQGWAAAGFDVPHVSVNYSAAQLADEQLADRIKWALDERNLTPNCLALEVVETVAVESDNALAVRTIRNLARAGFAIELDDFGTGHASIANIRRFGVSRIKIDRSFVSGIDIREDLAAMADAMVRMGSALGVGTIAEGVETAEERAKVIELGCDALQGYNIARPMCFEDTLIWLSDLRVLNRGRVSARKYISEP